MYPYIHIGPLRLGTYGIFVALGLLSAFLVVAKDLRRRAIAADPNVIVGMTGIAGLIGARLYHLAESPREFLAAPLALLFSSMGFAWWGSVIAGFLTLLFLARHYHISALTMLDIASPAAALGYGIGRIGCLVSGDGDYGIPTSLPWGMSFPHGLVPTTERVHPTPIYEFLAALVIFWVLWKLGARYIAAGHPVAKPRPHFKTNLRVETGRLTEGRVFATYLLVSGIARFLVEFIRLNPRSVFGVLTNAQTASLAGMVVGVILLARSTRLQHLQQPAALKGGAA
jgi:phosphatidylglycerol---prolipoprotein diacylglyceryl transferase